MRALLAIALVASVHVAEAGPFCWNEVGFAPYDHADLPVTPTIAYAVHDQYYGGLRLRTTAPPELTATIDGKRVSIIWNDIATSGGTIRMFSIRSNATGKLELWRQSSYNDGKLVVAATYTIVKDWKPGDIRLAVRAGKDDSLGPYRWLGDYAALRVDVPAIAFTVKWRARPQLPWRSLLLPLHAADAHADGWIGEELCGMRANIPLATLAKGIEIDVRAKLPDGREVPVTDGPTPMVFEPADPAPKPQRATRPPPSSG